MKKAAMNIPTRVLYWAYILISLGRIPEVQLLSQGLEVNLALKDTA